MSDIDRVNQASSPVRITDNDEQNVAQVSQKSSGKYGLEVLAEVTQAGGSGGATLPASTYRIIDSVVETPFAAAWQTVYSSTSGKRLSMFAVRTDTDDFRIRLIVNGNTLFDIDVKFFKDVIDLNNYHLDGFDILWNNGKDVFFFIPKYPFETTAYNVDIISNGGGKKIKGYYFVEY